MPTRTHPEHDTGFTKQEFKAFCESFVGPTGFSSGEFEEHGARWHCRTGEGKVRYDTKNDMVTVEGEVRVTSSSEDVALRTDGMVELHDFGISVNINQ